MLESAPQDRKTKTWVVVALIAVALIFAVYAVARLVATSGVSSSRSNGAPPPINLSNVGNLGNQSHLPFSY